MLRTDRHHITKQLTAAPAAAAAARWCSSLIASCWLRSAGLMSHQFRMPVAPVSIPCALCHKLSSRRLKKKKLTIAKNGERWCVTVECVFGGTWPTLSPFAAANYFSAVRVCLPAVPRDGSSLSSCAAQPPDPLLARLVTPCPPRHQWCTVQPRWQRRSWAAHAQQWSGPSSCRVRAMFRGRRSAALSARP